jgi:hypothetical protein
VQELEMITFLSHFISVRYEVVSESGTFILVTASAKEDERGGQGHTSTSLLHQTAMHCFYKSAFFTSFCLQMMAKSSNASSSNFA